MASSGVRGVSSSTRAKAVLFRAKDIIFTSKCFTGIILMMLVVEEAAKNAARKLGYQGIYSST